MDDRTLLAGLRLLLNTRVGESPAAPDFGVPDLADLLHQFPAASSSFQQAVRAAVVRHLPRLHSPAVRPLPGPTPGFLLTATVDGAPIQLRVTLAADGRCDLA
jgi:predicted component of type VI protein secretion system